MTVIFPWHCTHALLTLTQIFMRTLFSLIICSCTFSTAQCAPPCFHSVPTHTLLWMFTTSLCPHMQQRVDVQIHILGWFLQWIAYIYTSKFEIWFRNSQHRVTSRVRWNCIPSHQLLHFLVTTVNVFMHEPLCNASDTEPTVSREAYWTNQKHWHTYFILQIYHAVFMLQTYFVCTCAQIHVYLSICVHHYIPFCHWVTMHKA